MDGSTTINDCPVVLRFGGMYPHHLGGYEAHRTRKGGDLGHVDENRSELNRRLIGEEDWAATALEEIREMAACNYAAELEALEKRKRHKDLKRRMVEGPKQPWRPTRHGPMREVILTANKDWFDADLSQFFGEDENAREAAFQERAVTWLRENFGDDVIHARADSDEAAYHIHAVIMPRATVVMEKPNAKTPVARATRQMLQPSIHPLIKDYEAAQDSVGDWFADIGLVRGERRADAIRVARAKGEKPPKKRWHARTAVWRAEEEARLAAETARLEAKAAVVQAREDEAEAVLAVAEGLSAGELTIDDAADEPKLVDRSERTDAPDSVAEARAARMQKSPNGVARALAAFGAAWTRLRRGARATADAEAEAGVASAVAEVAAADDVIVKIAQSLPDEKRMEIAGQRKSLTTRLLRLRRWTGSDGRDRSDERGNSSEAKE